MFGVQPLPRPPLPGVFLKTGPAPLKHLAKVAQPGLVILSPTLFPPLLASPAIIAHFLTSGANHSPPLTSSAADAERQSVTQTLGDATLPAAFRTLR